MNKTEKQIINEVNEMLTEAHNHSNWQVKVPLAINKLCDLTGPEEPESDWEECLALSMGMLRAK